MFRIYPRPLGSAVRAIISIVSVLTVMVAGGLTAGEVAASELGASEMAAGCPAVGFERQQLRVRLVPSKEINDVLEPVQREVEELWRPYGVDIIWEEAWNEVDSRPKPELFVFFVDRELERGRGGATPVAWILFTEGTPRQIVNVSVSAARRLMNTTTWHNERPIQQAPQNAQERLLGRMIGRALAHEIGHYLLSSAKHAETGLMKPMISPAEFVRESRKHLTLVEDDARTLRTARMASCQLTASR